MDEEKNGLLKLISDATFAPPNVYEYLEDNGIRCTIRIRDNNRRLETAPTQTWRESPHEARKAINYPPIQANSAVFRK